MLTYPEIQSLFGAPLDTVIKPGFKMETWHIIVGAAVIGLAAYGGYTLFKRTYKPKIYIQDKNIHLG